MPDTQRYRVLMEFFVNLPADLALREADYGVTDPAECVMVDLENDGASFLCDNESHVVSVEALGK